jgi:MinD superfamily P-loop ATPase
MLTIAVSKGGTAKTTMGVNIALPLTSDSGERVRLLLHCDVEEPDPRLPLKPCLTEREAAEILIPHVDESRCAWPGRHTQACQLHAIAAPPDATVVLPALCHGCGGCTLACPEKAITAQPLALRSSAACPSTP